MSDAEGRLQALRLRFLARLKEEEAFFRSCLDKPEGDVASAEAGDRAHRLAGIAGSLGYAGISDAAKRVDAAQADACEPGQTFAVHLSSLVAAIQDEVEREGGGLGH